MTHSVRIALTTLAFFLLLGIVVKMKRGYATPSGMNTASPTAGTTICPFDNALLVPHLILPVALGAPESSWRDALSHHLGGSPEAPVEFGRIDVLTEFYAIEIDFFAKWQEGIGQALHYGDAAKRTPCLALILTESSHDMNKIRYIDRLCREKGIVLLLLTSSETRTSANKRVESYNMGRADAPHVEPHA